jgi:hypothetical protein
VGNCFSVTAGDLSFPPPPGPSVGNLDAVGPAGCVFFALFVLS